MTDRALIGLLLALVVESAHWSRTRWDFREAACARAWQACAIAIGLTTALIWLDGDRFTALPRLLTWLPPLLLPLQWVQSYGLRESMTLNTFSFFARKRRERNLRLGLQENQVYFHFGNFYFVATLVSATLGTRAEQPFFYAGMVLLGLWAFLALPRRRPVAVVLLVLVVTSGAFVGQHALERAYHWISRGGSGEGFDDAEFDPDFNRTAIGALGRIKQSKAMLWRLRPVHGAPPTLLRTASYNHYRRTSWEKRLPPGEFDAISDFDELDTLELVGGELHYLLREGDDASAIAPDLPRFQLRGASSAKKPLPLPGNAASLRGFLLDGIERNPLGTVRVYPKMPVLQGTVAWGAERFPERPPWEQIDLFVSSREIETLRRVAQGIGLHAELPLRAKLALLREWFVRDFTYSRYLSIPPSYPYRGMPEDQEISSVLEARPALPPDSAGQQNETSGIQQDPPPLGVADLIPPPRSRPIPPSEIGRFLTTTRSGHCEYFATAAALLLRVVGVPTRYAVGYAAMERDESRGDIVIRGIHGHAWCRVWDEERANWVDFDPTPPDWLSRETRPGSEFTQRLLDAIQRFKEDFFLWRNDPANRLNVMGGLGLFCLLLTAFLTKRLWKSRRQLGGADPASSAWGRRRRTPLHKLESPARRLLGPRPPGQPFADWLAGLRPALDDPAPLDEALGLHQRLRHDPASDPADPDALQRLEGLAGSLRQAISLRKNPTSKA